MKKIIAFMLCFMFTFGMIATARQKKADAITIVAGYTISQILGALALSATVAGAGYVVSDSLVNPDDNSEFTDFLQTVFQQTLDMHKYEIPPPPEPLSTLESVTLLSMLTKQGIEVGTDLYEKLYNFFKPTPEFQLPFALPNGVEHYIILQRDNNIWLISANTSNDITINGDQIIATNPVIVYYKGSVNWGYSHVVNGGIIVEDSHVVSGNMYPFIPKETPDLPEFIQEPETLKKPSEFGGIFKNIDMSPLNGIVKNPAELIDIINGVKKVPDYVYGKITTAFNDIYNNYLENPNFIGADEPITPIVEPSTGLQYYGDPLLDEPAIEGPVAPDNELSFWGKVLFWLKAIWQTLRDLPRLIFQPFKAIFENLFSPLNDILLKLLREWFIPSSDFISGKIDLFKDNFSFIDYFSNFVLLFEDMDDSGKTPFVTVYLNRFQGNFGGKAVSMGDQAYILDLRFYDPYKPIGDIMITAFVYIMFIWRFFGRLPEIISGAGFMNTADSKTDDLLKKLGEKK